MNKAKKILALLLCAVLLVGATVAGTVAYLTSEDEVTNTFTVGNVKIYLDETDVDESETDVEEGVTGRDKANDYHLMPGQEYVKDPRVTVKAGSEPCYIFVRVVNEITEIEDADATIASQMEDNWTLVSDETNVYYYKDVLSAGDTATVFEKFAVASDVTNEVLAAYGPDENNVAKTIVVTAYAVQQQGFANANAAWTAAKAELTK